MAGETELPQESSLQALYLQWALQHPDVNFTWLVSATTLLPELPNIKGVRVPALPETFAALQQWYRRVLPRIWDTRLPDLLIPVPGFVCTRLELPQMMWLLNTPGRYFLEKRFFSRWHYRRRLPAMLKKAKAGWVTDNGWAWLEDPQRQPDLSCWQMVTPVAVNNIYSKGQEAVRYDIDYQTGGRPYFASFIAGKYPTDTMHLMKSFSHFKKRQQTDWKLVLIGDRDADYAELKRAIDSYKYKQDVVLLEATTEDKRVVLDLAYALVQGAGQALHTSLLVMAFEQSCAVILAEKTAAGDWLKETPLYAGGSDTTGLAECMMRVYKDEELIKKLRTGSRQFFNSLTVENQALKAWQNVEALQQSIMQ